MNAQIAQHLNIAESAILEIQEWARVLWVRVRGIGARFVSKKVVKKMDWQDRDNLKIKRSVHPVGKFSDYGYLRWAEACDRARAGLIPSVEQFEVVYYDGGGIWSIGGYASTLDEAIEIANAQKPSQWDGGIPAGYELNDLGEMVEIDALLGISSEPY